MTNVSTKANNRHPGNPVPGITFKPTSIGRMQNLISLLVSIGLGLIIGLEREFRLVSQKDRFAGIRTFPLVALLGSSVGLVSQSTSPWILAISVFGIMLFAGLTYYVRSSVGHPGITTEVTIIITFVLGAMCSLNMLREALVAAVLTTTFLSMKDIFHSIVSRLTQEEIFAFVKFIVLATLVLSFLPNQGYGPGDILNPRDIGVVVVTVSLLSFTSYILMKFAGPGKGLLLSSILGGLVSSTMVAWIFSEKSRAPGAPKLIYASGIILASSIMPLRIAVIAVIFVKPLFLEVLLPCIIMSSIGLVYALLLLRKEQNKQAPAELDLGNPLSLTNSLVSTALYVGVLLLVYYSKIFFGNNGLLISGFISGLADVDAITIAMSDLVGKVEIVLPVQVVLVAIISNSVLKTVLVAIKSRGQTRAKVVIAMSLMTLSAAIYIATRELLT